MKKLFLLLVTLLTVCFLPAAYAQTNVFPAEGQNATITGSWTFNGVTSINLVSYTVSTLPAPATVPTGFIVTVTDSLTSGSCTTGSGFQVSLCRNSGLAWVSLVPSGTQVYPPSGIAVSTGSVWAAAATATNIIALWTAPCNSSTYLRGDGFCQTPTGAGNVSNVGTPTNGQLAQWTSATTIQGVTVLPPAAMPALTGDVTNSAGSLATTVGKINGTSLAGLATGLLKNTTTSGVPSIALSTDVIALWTGTCNSTTFLRADGSCQTASGGGGGTVTITGTPTNHQTAVWTSATAIQGIGPGTTGYPFVSGGASADPSYAQLSLTAGVTGILPIANGGTNTSSTLTGLVRGGASYTAAELSGDATTNGSNAVTVTKLNGTSLAGLGTGILKNTTGTGVPSIAASADVIGLWSGSCSSSTYLGGGGACGTGTQYALLDWATSSTIGSACTPPSTNGTFVLGYSVTSSAAVQANCNQVGLTSSTISGATSTYTVLYSDAAAGLIIHDVAGSAAVAVTLPTPTTLVNTNPVFVYVNHSAKNDTITPTTWTIQTGTATATSSLTVPPGASVRISVDPFNATTWDADMVPSMTGVALPLVVSGIATTATDVLKLINTTASTAGVPVQYSPSIHFQTHVWNTTSVAADNCTDWVQYVVPTSNTSPYSTMTWKAQTSASCTAPAATVMSVDQFGDLGLAGAFNATAMENTANGHVLITFTAPTIASGFNTSGFSVAANNGPSSFIVTVGTGSGTSTGVLTLPAAAAGWNCFASNRTRADYIAQTSADSTTSVTLTNYGTGFSATNFTNSDSIQVSCFAH